MDKLQLSKTSVSYNCKYFRLINKIENRIQYFIDACNNVDTTPRQIKILTEFQDEWELIISRLDSYKLITNTHSQTDDYYLKIYQRVNKWSDRKTHLRDLLGIGQKVHKDPKDSNVSFFLDLFAQGATLNRLQIASARLKIEFTEAKQKNWFILFSTLTVNPDNYEKVFIKGSNIWRNYIRSIDSMAAAKSYGSTRKASGKNYFKYFAVIEQGGKTNRLHIHVMMFFKNLPDITDPNLSRKKPIFREVKELKQKWKYGFSSHIPIRFGQSDPYAKLGWVYPIDPKTEQPIPVSTIGKVTGYMIKYVLKSKQIKLKQGVQTWKFRMTRTLGVTTIKSILTELTDQQILILANNKTYPTQIMMYGEKIPSRLINYLAIKETFNRKFQYQTKMKDRSMKDFVKSTTPTKLASNPQSFTSTLMSIMKREDIFKGSINEYMQIYNIYIRKCPDICDVTNVSGGTINSEKLY